MEVLGSTLCVPALRALKDRGREDPSNDVECLGGSRTRVIPDAESSSVESSGTPSGSLANPLRCIPSDGYGLDGVSARPA